MAYKVFTNGSVLNASEINDNLMNQAVMVFSNSTARTAAITTPLEGMLTWLQDTNKYENYNGSAWVALGGSGILQVVSTSKTDTFSTSSTSYVDLTGLTATITPSSATSKLLIMWGINMSQTATGGTNHLVLTDGSNNVLLQGDTSSNRTRVTEGSRQYPANSTGQMEVILNYANSFLYSPATTSAVTVKFRIKAPSGTAVVNRNGVFFDDAANAVPVSSLTVMEVAG